MGKPAARIGDMTAHGGTITGPGVPTVLIGGMPAATLGDMHVCPMVTPGTPPIPHVGGPITLGSTGVLIGKKPAARMGDMAVCVGPPSTIVMGCPTVLIGEVGGGGGSGGGGAGVGAGGGKVSEAALTSSSIAGKPPEENQIGVHFIDLVFEDKAKIAVGGMRYKLSYPDNSNSHGFLGKEIKRNGVPEGNYEVELYGIVNVGWSKRESKVGEEVGIVVETIGIADGERGIVEVYLRDSNYTDHCLDVIEAEVRGDKIEIQWKMEIDEKYRGIIENRRKKKRYSAPFLFFKVSIGEFVERSGFLYVRDWIEIELYDHENKPIKGEKFRVILGDGRTEEGVLDSNGKKRIEDISPVNLIVEFPDREDI